MEFHRETHEKGRLTKTIRREQGNSDPSHHENDNRWGPMNMVGNVKGTWDWYRKIYQENNLGGKLTHTVDKGRPWVYVINIVFIGVFYLGVLS